MYGASFATLSFHAGINHRLSRPLGNLVPTRYKIAFRLGALLLVLGGAAMADEPRRRRR